MSTLERGYPLSGHLITIRNQREGSKPSLCRVERTDSLGLRVCLGEGGRQGEGRARRLGSRVLSPCPVHQPETDCDVPQLKV